MSTILNRPFPYAAVGTGVLLLAAAASWSSVLLVVGGRVVPGWMLGAGLMVGALVLMGVRGVRGRRRSVVGDRVVGDRVVGDRVGPGYPFRPSTLRRLGYGLSSVLAVLGVGFGALGDLGAEYLFLRPGGPEGCRAVVRETAFLMAGSGEVYAVGGSTGVAWGPSGSWFADDGYRPVAEGSYELRWGRSDGSLLVGGTSGNPVYPSLHTVDCG
ncbi:hypothetical protein AB0D34_31125 [Streptomyces sp. NPDC048420]|uniref:hypothetical protein n=1 Tax=Streptomyces sp. NPDC048420 TaxID=3155755 RepID=UPI0034400C03